MLQRSCYRNRVKMKSAKRLLEDEIHHCDSVKIKEMRCAVCEERTRPMATEARTTQRCRLFRTRASSSATMIVAQWEVSNENTGNCQKNPVSPAPWSCRSHRWKQCPRRFRHAHAYFLLSNWFFFYHPVSFSRNYDRFITTWWKWSPKFTNFL